MVNSPYSNPQGRSQTTGQQKLSVTDLWYYLVAHWWWFVIAVVVCGSLAWLYCASSPRIYYRSATVVIKDPENKSYSAGLDRLDNYINRVNVANEVLQFKSATLMTEVVKRLDANMCYSVKDTLRQRELYSSSPIKATIGGIHPERPLRFNVVPLDSTHVAITDITGVALQADKRYKLQLGTTMKLDDEGLTLTVSPTRHYTPQWRGREIEVNHQPLSDMVLYFQGNMSIRQAEDETSILTVAMQDVSGQRAVDVINILIDVYNTEAINDKNRVAINTGQFIDERIRIIENELGGVESELQQFKRQHGIVDIGSTTSRYMAETERFDMQEIEHQAQLEWARYVKNYLENPVDGDYLIPTQTGLAGMNLEQQISQYNSLMLKRQRLSEESGASNPVLEEMDDHLHSSRQAIIRSIDNLIANLNQKRGNAAEQKSRSVGMIASIPATQREMLSIERQQKIKETLYMFLLNKREENALTQAMADNNARMIDTPKGPRFPIFPKPKRTIALGIVLGVVLTAGILLFRLFIDNKVRSRKDFEGLVSVPFLGDIPFDKKTGKSPALLQSSDETDDMLAEAFRMLRTNLMFFNKPDHPVKVITLSSFNEGAGKTFLTINLARALARANKRVLVIDLDVRKGTLTRSLSARRVGVTNYIIDPETSLQSIVQTIGNIDFIASGAVAPNPAELLMDQRLDLLLQKLRGSYDFIIADNVPVGVVADATIANRIADLTLFVVRVGRFDRRQIPDIETLYQEGKLNNMVLVLNGVDVSHHYGYYGGYGYYGSYGYRGYGYGYGKRSKNIAQKTKDLSGRQIAICLLALVVGSSLLLWSFIPRHAPQQEDPEKTIATTTTPTTVTAPTTVTTPTTITTSTTITPPTTVTTPKTITTSTTVTPPTTITTSYSITGLKTTCTLQRGESLKILADRYYGDSELWPYIAQYNPKIKDPNVIMAGTKIRIPNLTPENN